LRTSLLSRFLIRISLVHRYLWLIAFACLACATNGCKNKQASARAQEPRAAVVQTAPSAPNPTQGSAAPNTSTTADSLDCDALCKQAKALSNNDIRKSMELLEAAIARVPDDPRSAPYYLQLGRLKKEYENYQGYNAGTPELSEKQKKEFVEYAKARPTEYFFDEIGADYLYLGTQFKELEKKFPTSPLAADAGYEITNLSQGGECEGFILCYVEGAFAPVRAFLQRYPDTPHTAEAVQRADDAFRKNLWGEHWKTDLGGISDPTKPSSDYYDPNELKKLVAQYEELAEKLPPRFRPRVWETVAYYRGRFGEKDRAKSLYQRILKENPEYENNAEIRKQLAAFQ
jgi:hypothetical protein